MAKAVKGGVLRAVKKVRGGVKVAHHKNTAELEVVRIPTPSKVVIPMQQHIGAPCEPVVKVGDEVAVGQLIGDSDKFVSAPIHASVSGTVTAIGDIKMPNGSVSKAVTIESDGEMRLWEGIKPPKVETREDLIKAVRDSGLVGLGGAGFPTHVKLNFPPDKNIDTLVVNAAECEPYITVDYRECMENSWDILSGVYALKELLGFKQVIIAAEDNKPEAFKVLGKIADHDADIDDSVKLMVLESKYPQGAEKMMVQSATGRRVPPGKLPADVGCVVSNTSTAKAISDAIQKGLPLVERVVSVTGEFIRNPGNYIVKLGTNVQEIIDHCGGITGDDVVLKMGGPMMGAPIKDTNVPIIKGSNGIIAIAADHTEEKECIKCGRCMDVCPMELAPLDIYKYAQLGDAETLLKLNVMDCFSCKCCEYICSSKIPLVSKINAAKGLVMPLLKKK